MSSILVGLPDFVYLVSYNLEIRCRRSLPHWLVSDKVIGGKKKLGRRKKKIKHVAGQGKNRTGKEKITV
jgi:hypothetical protein